MPKHNSHYILRNYDGIPPAPLKDQIAPGLCFLRYDRETRLALFGQVLDFVDLLRGSVPTICYAQGMRPWMGLSPLKTMTYLLSGEQFELARSLGWSTAEADLMRVFNVPAN